MLAALDSDLQSAGRAKALGTFQMGDQERDEETKRFGNKVEGCIATVDTAINGCWFTILAVIVIVAAALLVLL